MEKNMNTWSEEINDVSFLLRMPSCHLLLAHKASAKHSDHRNELFSHWGASAVWCQPVHFSTSEPRAHTLYLAWETECCYLSCIGVDSCIYRTAQTTDSAKWFNHLVTQSAAGRDNSCRGLEQPFRKSTNLRASMELPESWNTLKNFLFPLFLWALKRQSCLDRVAQGLLKK